MDYEKLYTAYYMQVYSYVMTLAKNRDTAEEITQHTFFKAMSTAASYRGQSDELTWLCAIARNVFYDERRKAQRFGDMPPEEMASGEDVEKAAEDADMAYRIHKILHRLEEPYKEVFQLRVFGQLSYHQIGGIFGKTENWARVTYHRARLKIQERMNQNG